MTHTLPWQTPARNYYPLPKVLCRLGLSPGEIAVYSFLMYCENRTTYQCYPSYRTIGEAVGMSRNTVAKYVRQLEEKGLIRTERTTVTLKDGRKRQAEGIAAAKAKGVKFGRPPIPLPDNFYPVHKAWRAKKMTLKQAAATCGMPVGTFYSKAVRFENTT